MEANKASPNLSADVPTTLIAVSVLALTWVVCVLSYLTFHEMGIGNRGNSSLIYFYAGHVIFGGLIPLAFGALINSKYWWSYRVIALLLPAFVVFYGIKIIQMPWSYEVQVFSLCSLVVSAASLEAYILFSPSVSNFYQNKRNRWKSFV